MKTLPFTVDPPEPRSCPFCGCSDVSLIDPSLGERSDLLPVSLQAREWRIWCPGCASYWTATDGTYRADGAEITIEQWNRRKLEADLGTANTKAEGSE